MLFLVPLLQFVPEVKVERPTPRPPPVDVRILASITNSASCLVTLVAVCLSCAGIVGSEDGALRGHQVIWFHPHNQPCPKVMHFAPLL